MSAPFPVCIVDELHTAMARLDLSAIPMTASVVDRPMRLNDDHGTVAISFDKWVPVDPETSGETGPADAGLNRYELRVEGLTKHTDEAAGRQQFAIMAKTIRTMLLRDQTLRVRLALLQEIDNNGVTERVTRVKIRQQRFNSGKVNTSFLHLSTTDIWVETETV